MATITSTGTWTKLATDLTALRDTAKPSPGVIPALAAADLNTIPPEIYGFIQLAAQGFGASFFDNQAPQSQGGTGTSSINVVAAAILVQEFLTAYIRRGLGQDAHDGLGSRRVIDGAQTGPSGF